LRRGEGKATAVLLPLPAQTGRGLG
jgi:hypothetical protein